MKPQAIPPTAEQHAWMKKNPGHVRTSHVRAARFVKRGTLRPDGTFVPESPGSPVMDGNGSFGVGVPIRRGRR